MAKWRWPAAACVLTLVRCLLFPSVSGLGAADAGADVPSGCPTNSDPTLVLYYPFDEGGGTTIHDCSGQGNDGKLVATSFANVWSTGHTGGAIDFTATNKTCVEVTSPALTETSDFTAAAWVQLALPYSSANGTSYIVGRRRTGVLGWRIAEDTNTSLSFQLGVANDASGYDQTAEGPAVTLSTWHHVAGVFRGGTEQDVYVDGVVAGSATAPAVVLSDPGTTLRIGCKGDDSSYFTGIIDDVRIYSRALSPAEVAALAK